MRNVFLYNQKRDKLEAIIPNNSDGILRIYCCGPTVYNFAHIGNFRTFLLQDVLRRLLIALGYNVKFVRNITDIDDKTIKGSQNGKTSLREFTDYWTKIFHEDCEKLNILPPDVEPKATDHIFEQIEMIQTLIDKNFAYITSDGSVYFKLSSCSTYGKISGILREQLKSQLKNSAGEINQADEYDRDNVHDFALWKARKPGDGDIFWKTPWGEGRPGWHIECSAMALKYLGETIDIHGGGIDLCFPHHENEVAQTESITGKEFVKHWFHSVHLQVEGQKMSKSLGNLYTVADLQKKGYNAASIRYSLINGYYRHVLNFTLNGVDAAKSAIDKLRAKIKNYNIKFSKNYIPKKIYREWKYFQFAIDALTRDLNIPKSLGAIFSVINSTENIDEFFSEELELLLYILGLREAVFCDDEEIIEAPKDIIAIAEKRKLAKENKQYTEADNLRMELHQKGWIIEDKKDGYSISKK